MSKPTLSDLLQHQREVIDQASRVETQLLKLEKLGVNVDSTRRALSSAKTDKVSALCEQSRSIK